MGRRRKLVHCVRALLGTLLRVGQGHSRSVQRPEPETKTAIILRVITAKKQQAAPGHAGSPVPFEGKGSGMN